MACFLLVGVSLVRTENTDEKTDVTKLDVVDLGEIDKESDSVESEAQKKRESGYVRSTSNRFNAGASTRFKSGQSGYRGNIGSRNPGQISRPFNKYGPPTHQNSPSTKGTLHSQQHQDKFRHSNHFGKQGSSLWSQDIPSPIRNLDFVEPSPIASQNNEPFGSNTANYLPPKNQKLPAYSSTENFSSQMASVNLQNHGQGHSGNFQNQYVQAQGHQISDAALFLTQNAQAIQQLYGAPAMNQNFAPNDDQFIEQNTQIQNPNEQFQNLENSHSNRGFQGPLPSYASGTLNPQETLEHIQSLEKDRLIAQLQEALAAQSESQRAEPTGRYAQSQGSYVQSEQFFAPTNPQFPPLDKRPEIPKFTTQSTIGSFGTSDISFNQSPFFPTTTIGPTKFPLGYGISTTTQAPATTTNPTQSIDSTSTQPQGTRGDGSSNVGTSLPAPNQPGTSVGSPGFPIYGGFVPTLIGTNLVPSYGTGFFSTGTSVQTAGSSPTHFGLPIPTNHGQKPSSSPISPSTTPSTISDRPGSLQPVQPSTPLHPVTPIQPILPSLHPVATPVHPLATPIHPIQGTSSSVHPTYGLQTPLVNPIVYKPVKPVYPVYYYTNLAYQLQKPSLSTFPWSYAPAYPQVKPAQIWK